MKRTANKRIIAKFALVLGAFLLAVPVLAALDEPADAEVEVEATAPEQTAPVSYTALGLADRNSIQLDENEAWADDCFHLDYFCAQYPFSKYIWLMVQDEGKYVGCNSPFGKNNTQKNHYGLHTWQSLEEWESVGFGHAAVFAPKWDASKGAYSIGNYRRYGRSSYAGCTYKWWNLADKKTSNHTKIQSWTGDSRKKENLFWISYYTDECGDKNRIRIWNALSGRPVGYTTDDLDNLKTLDNHEANTYQVFRIDYMPRT